ncbi:MAG: hypothetical protein ABI591_19560, partial [Kofleriaceae bacterium]
ALSLAAALAGCGADVLNNAAIHAHVDELVAHDRANAVPADRWALTAAALVPILGSYELDTRVYGSVRPSAIVIDWILGGLLPAATTIASFAVDDAHTRSVLRWSALGLYGTTRIGVIVVGNLHIDEYDHTLAHQLETGPRAHVAMLGWSW